MRSSLRQLRLLLMDEKVAEHLLMHRIEALLDSESLSQWSLRQLPAALPTLAQMYEFLELRASALMGLLEEVGRPMELRLELRSKGATAPLTFVRGDERRPDCKLCPGEQHWPFMCAKFKALSLNDRWARVQEWKRCANCFSSRHKTAECQEKKCPRCRAPHNRCLCPSNSKIERPPATYRRAIEASGSSASANAESQPK